MSCARIGSPAESHAPASAGMEIPARGFTWRCSKSPCCCSPSPCADTVGAAPAGALSGHAGAGGWLCRGAAFCAPLGHRAAVGTGAVRCAGGHGYRLRDAAEGDAAHLVAADFARRCAGAAHHGRGCLGRSVVGRIPAGGGRRARRHRCAARRGSRLGRAAGIQSAAPDAWRCCRARVC